MTQEAIALRTSGDTYPGLAVVQDVNKALQTVATDFAGPDDPAALAGPYMTWADTGNMLQKRRNAANTDWVTIGALLSYGSAALAFKAAPSTVADEVTVQSQVFGVGQTLQNLTASRGNDVVYTNSTGKPIQVYVVCTIQNAGGQVTLFVSGNPVSLSQGTIVGGVLSVSANVLPGLSYVLGVSSTAITGWYESR